MNKLLRYSFVAIMAVLGMGNAMAEDVIWSEDFSSYEAGGVPSGGTYNYVCVDGGSVTKIYNEALAGGTAPELLVGKKKDEAIGSFTAKINLGSKSGDMTLSFKCNKNIGVEVTGGTLGSNTGSGNDYVYPITGASGTLTIVFKNTLSSNARLDNIKLSQGEGKKPAGLSWGTSSRTVTLGADDNVFPTLTNENGLTITYDSSDKTCATIDATGAITLVAAGKTDISAAFDGNDEYEAAKVTYTLTVKAAPVKVTVAEALKIIADLEDGKTTTDDYIVSGFIVTDPAFGRKTDETLYGNVDFQMADTKDATENLLTVYRAKNIGNKDFTEETTGDIKKGYGISIQGQLQKYVKDEVTTPEIKNCYLVSITVPPVNVAIAPEPGNISEALKAELAGATAKNVSIKLAAGGKYTITEPIVATGDIMIQGGDGTEIDATALEGPLAQWNGEEPADWTPADVYFKNFAVKGLSKAMFYSAGKKYYGDFVVDNCFVEVAGDATTFDFTKGSVALNVTVTNSTFYAPTATTKAFYSSQSGQKTTEYQSDAIQTFKFQNNTMYNLAKSKNFFSHRQNSQKWLTFIAKNNIFVNCGKSGQVIKGMNGGGSSANPTFDIDGNAFNFEDADTSANEETGDAEEPVKNSVAGVVKFTDAAAGNFNGSFELADGAEEPTTLGDPRWTLAFTTTAIDNITKKAIDIVAPMFNLSGQRVNSSYKGVVIQNGKKIVNK